MVRADLALQGGSKMKFLAKWVEEWIREEAHDTSEGIFSVTEARRFTVEGEIEADSEQEAADYTLSTGVIDAEGLEDDGFRFSFFNVISVEAADG